MTDERMRRIRESIESVWLRDQKSPGWFPGLLIEASDFIFSSEREWKGSITVRPSQNKFLVLTDLRRICDIIGTPSRVYVGAEKPISDAKLSLLGILVEIERIIDAKGMPARIKLEFV